MATRRGRSSISRLPAPQKARIDALARAGRNTLDEMITILQREFPGEPAAAVSRSALHRYDKSMAELTGRMREIDRAAAALVGELGEGIGEKSGALLAQAVTTLATNAALRAQESDDMPIEDIRKLAVAAKNALDTRRLSLNERRVIAQEAREELLREQSKALDSVVKSSGLSAETAEALRRQLLGVG